MPTVQKLFMDSWFPAGARCDFFVFWALVSVPAPVSVYCLLFSLSYCYWSSCLGSLLTLHSPVAGAEKHLIKHICMPDTAFNQGRFNRPVRCPAFIHFSNKIPGIISSTSLWPRKWLGGFSQHKMCVVFVLLKECYYLRWSWSPHLNFNILKTINFS